MCIICCFLQKQKMDDTNSHTDGWDDLVGQCLDEKTSTYHCYYKAPHQHCLVSYMIQKITATGVSINFLPSREAGYVILELLQNGKPCKWVVVHPWSEKYFACNVDICGTDCKYFDMRYVEGGLDRACSTCHQNKIYQTQGIQPFLIYVPGKRQFESAPLHCLHHW